MGRDRNAKKSVRSRRIYPRFHRSGQIVGRAQAWYSLKRKGTIGFGIKNVAGFGISSPQISEYTMNLYREVSLLKKAIDGMSFKRSLEIGCGYGRVTPWITGYSKEHHAVEPEPSLLKLAAKSYLNVKFHKATAQELPFPDNYFDLIVSFSVLHHIPPQEFYKAVQEIKRVACPTATIFLHERVKGKEGYKQRSWIHKYENAFSPWKLASIFDRNISGLGKDKLGEMRAMLFQGSTRTKEKIIKNEQ